MTGKIIECNKLWKEIKYGWDCLTLPKWYKQREDNCMKREDFYKLKIGQKLIELETDKELTVKCLDKDDDGDWVIFEEFADQPVNFFKLSSNYKIPKQFKRYWLWALKGKNSTSTYWFMGTGYMDEAGLCSNGQYSAVSSNDWNNTYEKRKLVYNYIDIELPEVK